MNLALEKARLEKANKELSVAERILKWLIVHSLAHKLKIIYPELSLAYILTPTKQHSAVETHFDKSVLELKWVEISQRSCKSSIRSSSLFTKTISWCNKVYDDGGLEQRRNDTVGRVHQLGSCVLEIHHKLGLTMGNILQVTTLTRPTSVSLSNKLHLRTQEIECHLPFTIVI